MKKNTKLEIYDTPAPEGLSLSGASANQSSSDLHLEIQSSFDTNQGLAISKFSQANLRDRIKQIFEYSNSNLKLSLEDKLYLFENMQMLLESGISILDSLNILKKQAKSKKIIFLLDILISSIKQGKNVSVILQSFQNSFNSNEIGLVKAGESIGRVANSFSQIAESLRDQISLRKEIKKASTYPVIVLLFTLLVVVAMLKFVIPQVSELFISTNAELPAVTQFLITLSDYVSNNLTQLFLSLLSLIVLASLFLRTQIGSKLKDFALLNLPLIKKAQQLKNQAIFARTLGSLMQNGVPIIRSIEITQDSISNSYVKNYISFVLQDVKRGIKLNEAMFLSPYFSEFFLSQIAVGENSANLPEVASKIAKLNHLKLSDYLQNLTKLLQPAIMLILGTIVATVVLAIMLPLSQMMSQTALF